MSYSGGIKFTLQFNMFSKLCIQRQMLFNNQASGLRSLTVKSNIKQLYFPFHASATYNVIINSVILYPWIICIFIFVYSFQNCYYLLCQ